MTATKNKYKIYAYKTGSNSARKLADALGVVILRHEGSTYTPKAGDVVINWGSGKDFAPATTLNHPDNVRKAVNKIKFFNTMFNSDIDVKIPWFTSYYEKAKKKLDSGMTIVARLIVDGHEGQGIVIVEPGQELPYADLYVEYIDKDKEFRIHVLGGKVIDVMRKVFQNGKTVHRVRNTANGAYFTHTENFGKTLVVPEEVKKEAVKAVEAIGLDFGAVDVVWCSERGAFVLEVNTAPGIVGIEVEKYAEAFKQRYNI